MAAGSNLQLRQGREKRPVRPVIGRWRLRGVDNDEEERNDEGESLRGNKNRLQAREEQETERRRAVLSIAEVDNPKMVIERKRGSCRGL